MLVSSILVIAPVLALEISSPSSFSFGRASSGISVNSTYSQIDELIAKWGNISNLTKSSRESMEKVFEEVENGTELLDRAFERLVSKSIPKASKWASKLAARSAQVFEVFETNGNRLRFHSPPSLNVSSTKQYSGYLDFGEDYNNHLFFWFFESRNDPKKDPIILWLNGGPGCSSVIGLFFELGPSSIDENLNPKFNPYSWINNASIIFIDQPVNVGLSYSDDNTEPVSSVDAARDVYALLDTFFQKFPEYAQNDFHIAGESYGGHYIPALGVEICSHKNRSFKLSSLIIGNGLTDPAVQYTSYRDIACGQGGYPSRLNSSICEQMKEYTSICLTLINLCYIHQSHWPCLTATIYCNNKLHLPYLNEGYSFYDIRLKCDDCYPEVEYGTRFMNQSYVQEALGVPSHINFRTCNFEINKEFMNDGDWMRPYHYNVTSLLNDGVPVLIYAGDADFAVSWLGTERWTYALPWNNSTKFQAEPLKPWNLDGVEVGQVRSFGPLTLARISGGGHMTPHDQPKNSLELINRWISKKPFTN